MNADSMKMPFQPWLQTELGNVLKEIVYNLFIYVEKSLIKALGIAVHTVDGTDEEKLLTLQMLVATDYMTAKRYTVKSKFEWREYEARMRLGRQLEIFEEIFSDCNASSNPLYAITPIVDEMPRILAVSDPGPQILMTFEVLR